MAFTMAQDQILPPIEPCFKVHTSVQNTDDLYRIDARLAIEDHVAAYAELPVTVPNVATILTLERISGQLLKTTIQHC